MNPILGVLLLSWAWRPEIILTLLFAATVHLTGRLRLGKRSHGSLLAPWRSISYISGLAILWIALMSPIDVLSGQLFSMHMIQHLLLVMIAPPLLLIANPTPTMMWGLPRALRREVGRWLRPEALFRRVIKAVTSPGIVWLLFVATLVGWHDPQAYNATLESGFVHDLEHLSFFGSALLFWWHVAGAAPRLRKPMPRGVRIAYVLSVVPPNMLTGVAIAFASEPLYTYYTTVPRLGKMSVLQDQMLGGILMWIPGSMMYLIAALILVSRVLRDSENRESRPDGEWGRDESMIAPGLDDSQRVST